MKSKNVLLSGYYGFDNSGDDAILKAIVSDIRKKNRDIDIKVLSKNPEKTERMYSVKAINRFKLKEVYSAMKNADLFISGGGSLLQDITSTRSLLYYLALMKLAKFLRKPVMVYANGIGPIDGRMNRHFTRKILNRVDLITLRDESSRVFVVDELKVKNKKIKVTADPVFTLQPSDEERVNQIFKSEDIPKDKKIIGISVRKWKLASNLTETMAKSIDEILKKYDVNVVLVPMHYPEDLEISEDINKLVTEAGSYVLKDKYPVEDIMGVINEFEMIVAMRLHSLIYAATMEVPMVGLSYDPKIEGILKSLSMEKILDVETFQVGELIDSIDYVWNNLDEIKGVLIHQDAELKRKALSNVEMALDLLENR